MIDITPLKNALKTLEEVITEMKMDRKISLDEKNFSIVCDILKRNLKDINVKTYIFGSKRILIEFSC